MLKMGTSGPLVECDWCHDEIRKGGFALYRPDGFVAYTHAECRASLEMYNAETWQAWTLNDFLASLIKGM